MLKAFSLLAFRMRLFAEPIRARSHRSYRHSKFDICRHAICHAATNWAVLLSSRLLLCGAGVRLFHDRLQILQLWEIRFLQNAFPSNYEVQLLLCPFQHIGPLQQRSQRKLWWS